MDAVDLEVIQKFVETPFVIEAPLTASAYSARAAAVLAGARLKLNTEDMGDVPYRKALEGVRRQVAQEFDPKTDRIEFFDLTAEDAEKEAARIDEALVRDVEVVHHEVAERGAFAFGMENVTNKPICVVVGPSPGQTAEDFFSGTLKEGIDVEGVSNEDIQRTIMWHELGHCLLGSSENKADTFAALMTIRHMNNPNLLPVLASWREFDEMTSPEWSGDYFISQTLWKVVALEGKLRNSKKFMEMGVKDIASLAEEISGTYAFKPESIEHMRRFRVALNRIYDKPRHYIRVAGGMKRVGPEDWVLAHVDQFPEFKRFDSLADNLKVGATPLHPFVSDPAAFRATMKKLSDAGDRTARAFLKAYDHPRIPKNKMAADIGPRIGWRAKPSHMLGEIIKVNKDSERIKFSYDNDVWVVQDKVSGNVLRAGSSSLGHQWSVRDYKVQISAPKPY